MANLPSKPRLQSMWTFTLQMEKNHFYFGCLTKKKKTTRRVILKDFLSTLPRRMAYSASHIN